MNLGQGFLRLFVSIVSFFPVCFRGGTFSFTLLFMFTLVKARKAICFKATFVFSVDFQLFQAAYYQYARTKDLKILDVIFLGRLWLSQYPPYLEKGSFILFFQKVQLVDENSFDKLWKFLMAQEVIVLWNFQFLQKRRKSAPLNY